jgi:hypothetical protein
MKVYPIEGVVGFEILRGSREGNRTILAKGMINNFRTLQLKDAPLGVNGSNYNTRFIC